MPEGQRHLTYPERCQIHALMESGLSGGAIARQLGRSPSSVPRGIRRNGGARGYRHAQAQRLAEGRRSAASSVPRKMTPGLWALVEERLAEGWSPEQVSGRLRLEGHPVAGRQWIYRHVHADRRAGGRLWRHLRRRGKRPNRKGGAHAGRGHIPGRVDIPERPAPGEAKTDRIDARKMVRALRAWDGGDRDAMSPVRVPTVAEEDAKRLPPRRERLVRERRRLANAVAGLLRLHGVPPGDPARRGYRARPGGMRTACGTGLPPGLLAEIGGIPGRLELVAAGLKAVEAEKAATLRPDREAAAREARDGPGEDGCAQAETPPGAASAEVPAHARHAAVPGRLRGIGPNDALLPGAELSCRDLRNRRQPGGMAGLAPVPWPGGAVDHARGPARPAARCRQGTWRGWPGAGCGTSRRARCRSGSSATSAPATGVRAGAGSSRCPGSFRGRRCGSPRPGWRTGAPSCRRRRRRGRRTPDIEHPGGPTAPRGTRAGRVTGGRHGSPHPAAPSIQMGPVRPERRTGPNRAPWSRGRRSPDDRTGQEPGRAVRRSPHPRRSARSVPRAGAEPPPKGDGPM